MSTENNSQKSKHKYPQIDIIDLEEYDNAGLSEDLPEELSEEPEEADIPQKPPFWKRMMNIHTFFIALVIIIVIVIIIRLSHWGTKIDVDEFFKEHELITSGEDTFDVYMSLTNENGDIIANEAPHTILFFGNGAFAQDRDSEDNVVNMIAKKTGSTVYNCSVDGSFLAAKDYIASHTQSGIDIYNFYYLTLYLTFMHRGEDLNYFDWLESNPEANILPETKELRRTLETIDMSSVDTIAIMYDGSDYLAGSKYNNPEWPCDICTFCGNLAAGLEVLQEAFPSVRIIVMSPTYAFGLDENGNNISSDIKKYEGGEILSTYMLQQCESAVSHNVTYIDNIYGTFNEDEAEDYLVDNIKLNQKGREKLVKRFIKALTYYDKK